MRRLLQIAMHGNSTACAGAFPLNIEQTFFAVAMLQMDGQTLLYATTQGSMVAYEAAILAAPENHPRLPGLLRHGAADYRVVPLRFPRTAPDRAEGPAGGAYHRTVRRHLGNPALREELFSLPAGSGFSGRQALCRQGGGSG